MWLNIVRSMTVPAHVAQLRRKKKKRRKKRKLAALAAAQREEQEERAAAEARNKVSLTRGAFWELTELM